MHKEIAKFTKKHRSILSIAALAVLIGFSLVVVSSRGQQKIGKVNSKDIPAEQIGFSAKTLPGQVPRLSETRGPSIDGEGAFSAGKDFCRECSVCRSASKCKTLPVGIWIFLLAAYVILIIFNLAFTFGKRDTLQWVWEAMLTLLALGVWFGLDGCRTLVWYPLFVIGLGALTYALYLYLFSKHSSTNVEDDIKA